MTRTLVVVKGGGDIGTGVAHRLFNSGMLVIITEIERPKAIRRTVSFAQAIYQGEFEVEGVTAKRIEDFEESLQPFRGIPVLVDERADIVKRIQPEVVVDAIMAKRNLGTKITDAPIVIGLGPGFTAGGDVHAVVETKRGHFLGMVIYQGEAEKNTGIPGQIEGYTIERILRAPRHGKLRAIKSIGDLVDKGDEVASVEGHPVISQISGVLRGMLQDGLLVLEGEKIGDVDPRAAREYCFTISDRARAVGGGVLEAILSLRCRTKKNSPTHQQRG